MTDQGIVKLNHSESKEYAAHKWASESPAVQSQRDAEQAEQYQSRLATPLLDTSILHFLECHCKTLAPQKLSQTAAQLDTAFIDYIFI